MKVRMVILMILAFCAVPAWGDNAFKEAGKEVGQGFRKMGKEVGPAAKKTGRTVGEWFRETGAKTGAALRKIGNDIRRFFKGE